MKIQKIYAILILLLFVLGGCVNNKDNNNITRNKSVNFSGEITKEFLKEGISGQNSENEERVNIIFDCRNMDKQEFDSCVNYLWRFFNDEPSNIPNISFGLFQSEPFKSSQNKFNVWYIDRNLMDPEFAFNTKSQSCDMSDRTFTYDKNLRNVILVYICKDKSFAFSNLFPIMGKTPETLTPKEKDTGISVFNLGPGNVKSVTSIGINEIEMKQMDTEPSALGLSLIFTHEMGHAIGGLTDEYSGIAEDKENVNSKQSEQPIKELSNITGGFPNCAPSIKTANLWWKNTGLLQTDQKYVNGCASNYYIIPYKYTMMSKYFYDSSGHSAISSSDDLFSPIHRYWICRNIYNMTGSSSGVCLDYQNKYGFDKLPYVEQEK